MYKCEISPLFRFLITPYILLSISFPSTNLLLLLLLLGSSYFYVSPLSNTVGVGAYITRNRWLCIIRILVFGFVSYVVSSSKVVTWSISFDRDLAEYFHLLYAQRRTSLNPNSSAYETPLLRKQCVRTTVQHIHSDIVISGVPRFGYQPFASCRTSYRDHITVTKGPTSAVLRRESSLRVM